MKFKNSKYDMLIEAAITRYEQGGILSGDIVKISKNAFKNPKVKDFSEHQKAVLKDMMNSDLNIRVSAVKSIRPTTGQYYAGGQNAGTNSPTDHWVDICSEYAPGLWRNPITVPIEILELVDLDGQLAPVPDSLKYDSKLNPGKKAELNDRTQKMATKNTKIKSSKPTDGRSQAKKPVEYKKKKKSKKKKK